MKQVEQSAAAGNRFGRMARRITLVLALWLVVSGTAMAQGKKKEKEGPTKSYVGSYFIVIVGLGAGLVAALRASKRLNEPPAKVVDDVEED
jgi:hypothetical protein